MSRVLCLKGFWTFRMRTDVSQCFHSASTGTDTTTRVTDTATGTAVSYSGTAKRELGTAKPELATAISRTYIICERGVKRLWNVLNTPAPPHPLYLLGFQQIRERWNLFFENQFFYSVNRLELRETD